MITLKEINQAINNKIKAAIKDTDYETVPILVSDLSTTERPSIKVEIEKVTSGMYNSNCRERQIMPKIYFYASTLENYKVENLEIHDLLSNEFLFGIKIEENFSIPVSDFKGEVKDTILECSFNLETIENIPEELLDGKKYAVMEELNVNLKEEK